MKILYSLSFYCIAIFFLPSAGFAIDKDKHPIVTEEAINAFNQCMVYLGREDKKLSMVQGGTIAHYTRVEDESPICERLSNWHFHDAFDGKKNALKRKWGFINTSMHNIFRDRVKALGYIVNETPDEDIDRDIYLPETKEQIAGRIIHYIQDVGVPSHVAPIYHVKPETRFQRAIAGYEPDAFDALFTRKNIVQLKNTAIDKKACTILFKRFKNQNLTLEDLLNDFAAQTRERINQKIVPSSDKTWESEYWPLRGEKNSEAMLHPKNGKYGFLKFHNRTFSLDKEKCAVKGGTCLQFFRQQYLSIRDNTVQALMIIYLKQ